MKIQIWIILGVTLISILGIAPGFVWSQGIQPVDGSGNLIPGPPFIRILSSSGEDITDQWLPKPNEIVTIQVENLAVNGLSIHEQTSFPGACTNYPPNSGSTDDFDLAGNQLTPLDNGGQITIQATLIDGSIHHFVLPQDTDQDQIPDIFETNICGTVDCIAPDEDGDVGPVAYSTIGDGISALDEYRGFRVDNVFIRTNPMTKDFFVGTADAPQCEDGAFYTDPLISLSTYFTTADGALDWDAAFANLYTLNNDKIIVHRITKNEWVDNFTGYTVKTRVTLDGTEEAAMYDRRINANAIIPYGNSSIVKGIRFIECLDVSVLDPMGIADKNPPDLHDEDNGNAIVFTQRAYHYLQQKFDEGGPRALKYYTFIDGDWVASAGDITQEVIIKKALPWYVAHEIIHCLNLTRTDESTRKEPAGYHHVSGTGTNIDVRILHVVDRKESAYNNFYIPTFFGDSDKRDMAILSTQ